MLLQHVGEGQASSVVVKLMHQSTDYVADFYTSIIAAHLNEGFMYRQEQTATMDSKSKQEGRKGETGIDVLCKYFHLPIKEASDVLGICPTSLKKICRTHGLQRWPHRRVKSVEVKMARVCAISKAVAEEVTQPLREPGHDTAHSSSSTSSRLQGEACSTCSSGTDDGWESDDGHDVSCDDHDMDITLKYSGASSDSSSLTSSERIVESLREAYRFPALPLPG